MFGLIISLQKKERKHELSNILIFFVAGMLTSRVNMIIMEITLMLILFLRKKSIKGKSRLVIISILIVSLVPVLGVFLFSTNNTDNFIIKWLMQKTGFKKIAPQIINYYATTDIANVVNEHFSFDRLNKIQFIFGSMLDSKQDPGYTQYIYKVGILGLCFTMMFYIQLIYNMHIKGKEKNIILIFITIVIVLSVKNSYILARHVTEIILLLYNLYFIKEKNIMEESNGINFGDCANI